MKIKAPIDGVEKEGKLNDVIIVKTRRPNGTWRIQTDYDLCPTMTEQHSADITDVNVLMEKYKPDEIKAYIMAKNAHRMEITGHDFSVEPDLQSNKNIQYLLKQSFERLPEDLKSQFKNHVEFVKFIDNPANAEKMVKLGIMTKKQVADNQTDTYTSPQNSDAGANTRDETSPKKSASSKNDKPEPT